MTGGRLAADGSRVEPLTDSDSAERALAQVLPAGLFVSRSSAVLPVTGEYERGIAT